MRIIFAFVLVVPLAILCFNIATLIGGFLIALVLAWTSISLRTKIAGFCSSIIGVICAVALGYGIFRIIVGPESYSVWVFIASTVPLIIEIRKDFREYQRYIAAREQMLNAFAKSDGDQIKHLMDKETKSAHGSTVLGEIVGLVLAAIWFFW
jgi:hypothetical protein